MKRLSNPLEGRHALPAHLVARGGNDCTSTTCSSSSCVATVLVSSVLSARLALRLGPPGATPVEKPAAVPALHEAPPPLQRTALMAAMIVLLPAILVFLYPPIWPVASAMFFGLFAVVACRVSRPLSFFGRSIGIGVLALLMMILEMIVWVMFGLHRLL